MSKLQQEINLTNEERKLILAENAKRVYKMRGF